MTYLFQDHSPSVWEIEYEIAPTGSDRKEFSAAITAAREAFQDFNLPAFRENFTFLFGDEIADTIVSMHGSIKEEVLIQYMKRSLDELQTINTNRRVVTIQ